jgi:hypothetical protein
MYSHGLLGGRAGQQVGVGGRGACASDGVKE